MGPDYSHVRLLLRFDVAGLLTMQVLERKLVLLLCIPYYCQPWADLTPFCLGWRMINHQPWLCSIRYLLYGVVTEQTVIKIKCPANAFFGVPKKD
jgi:hypothetical protein